MSLSQLFGDPSMLFEALFGFLWTEDIVNVRLVCKGFNDVVETFKETLKKDVGYRNLIEDYEGYYEKVKKAWDLEKDCKFGWNWLSVLMKWDANTTTLISFKGDFKIQEDSYGIFVVGLRNGKREGNHISWHPRGYKWVKCCYKNDIEDGEFIRFHANGRKEFKCFYKDGECDGKHTKWHENGQKSVESFYEGDYMHGKYTTWYKNGQRSIRCFYKKGDMHGKFISWYGNGHKSIRCFYKKGDMHGKFISWRENGKLEKKCSYNKGVIIRTEYSEN